MPPLVSICLPVFNGEVFVAEAIESALAQTFRNFEFLIVDDRSTDRSFEIACDYAKRDPRISAWQNASNKGLFANYNAVMARANGTLIKPFAQDDYWRTNMLERCVSAFQSDDKIALVATQRESVDEHGTAVTLKQPFDHTTRLAGRQLITDCMLRRLNMVGEPSTVMFPRAYGGAGFDSNYYHLGDLEFWFRLLLQGDFFHIHEPLCTFRRHGASASNSNIKGLLFALDYFSLADQYAQLLDGTGLGLHEVKIGIAGDIARFVDEATDKGVITLAELMARKPPTELTVRQLDQFKELAFYALLAAASTEKDSQRRLQSLQTDVEQLETNLSAALGSKSWRATEFFRSAARQFESIKHRGSS